MTARDADAFNYGLLQDRWGELNGLRFDRRIGNGDRALLPLVDGRKDVLVARVEQHRRLSHEVFDHAHLYKSKLSGNRIVAVVTAPYLGVIERRLGGTAALNQRAHEIAQELGLFVRVGRIVAGHVRTSLLHSRGLHGDPHTHRVFADDGHLYIDGSVETTGRLNVLRLEDDGSWSESSVGLD